MAQVHPGQSTLIFYNAHNTSDKAITGVSTYNVAPQQAGYYFNKIQCFCFEEQKLRPGPLRRILILHSLDCCHDVVWQKLCGCGRGAWVSVILYRATTMPALLWLLCCTVVCWDSQ